MPNKIMLINSLGVGGAERVFSNLANYLSSEAVEFQVVSLISKIDYSIDSNVKVEFISKSKRLSHFMLPVYFVKFLILCLKQKPKVVQSHLFWSNYINTLCSILLGYDSHLVHCVSFDSKFKEGKVRTFHSFFCSALLKRANINIFKSLEMRDEYVKLFKIPLSKTKVIYNPISFEVIESKFIEDTCNRPLNIAVVGRFHQSKRHFDLLLVAEALSSEAVFHCVGEGELLADFQSEVIKRGLSKSFVFYGWLKYPIEILDTADVYLSCSESEGFPNALIEAMSRGLPAVHSDCKTGPKEILGKVLQHKKLYEVREYGVTFNVGNIESMISIFKDIKNNILDKNQLSTVALNRMAQLSKQDSFLSYKSVFTGDRG